MDRLARSIINAADIMERANGQGWSLVVLDLGVDLTTASGRLIAQVMSSFAEYERAQCRERTKAALAAKKRRGERLWRPRLAAHLHLGHFCWAGSELTHPAQFLTPVQVSALVAATPWPYNVMVHVAAWSGLRAAELAGLQVGDVDLPDPPLNPNASAKTGHLRVERTARALGADVEYLSPKTKGSYRRVPLILATTALLRDYLAEHPRADEPTAPLFPAMVLKVPRPTGRTGDARRWRSGQRGCQQCHIERDREGPCTTAGDRPGRTHGGRSREAAHA
jgi:integrase